MYDKQGIFWGCHVSFSPTLLLANFLICTYLSHINFYGNCFLASNFAKMYLFIVLVLKVARNDEDAIKTCKIL